MALTINNPKYGNIFIAADTFAELRSVSSKQIQNGYSAIVAGDIEPGDGFGGMLVWNATSTASDNSRTVIAPQDAQAGRWIKIVGGLFGPQGDGLATVMSPTGSSLVGYNGRTVAAVLDNIDITPEEFGAVGNRINDDGPAINAALAALATKGGGKLRLGRNKTYRTTVTIRVPDSCAIEGPVPIQYPFSGALGAAYIEADFPESNKLRWVVENATTRLNGAPYGYNEFVSGDLNQCIPTYNVSFRNFGIRSRTSVIPFGGLRINGAPGATVDGVGVAGVGTGLVLNFCFDGYFKAHSMGVYTGFAVWDDINACTLKLYAAQDAARPKVIPAAYRLGFMPAFDNTLVAARGMSTEAHTTRAFGLVMGSTNSLAVNNDITFVSERYSGAALLLNVSGAEFTRFYTEGSGGDVDVVIAAWLASFSIRQLHAFTSGGDTFDVGAACSIEVSPGGIINTASFGNVFGDGSTRILVRRTAPDGGAALAPPVPRPATIRHPDVPGTWTNLGAANGWTNATTQIPQYRINSTRLELRGFATAGVTGTNVVWTLPAGYRPVRLQNVTGGFGAQFSIDVDGTIKIQAGSVFGLDGVSIPLI